MKSLEEAAKEYSVLITADDSIPASYFLRVGAETGFKAGAQWQAEQAKVLEECLDTMLDIVSRKDEHVVTTNYFQNIARLALEKYRESK